MVSLNLPVAIFSWFWTDVLRVSIATWLQNKGYSEFERALVLNHTANSVTGGVLAQQPCFNLRRFSHLSL